jgi:hypothetical protein
MAFTFPVNLRVMTDTAGEAAMQFPLQDPAAAVAGQ